MHGLSIRTFTCKLGLLLRHNTLPKRTVQRLVDLSLLTSMRINFLQIRFLGQLSCNQLAQNVVFPSVPKLTRKRMADFCNRQKRYLIVLLTNDLAW